MTAGGSGPRLRADTFFLTFVKSTAACLEERIVGSIRPG
jgi:hypothetical protein